jgi:hypothetical protein
MKSLLGVLVISAAMIGSGIYLAYRENGNITAPEPQSAATKGAPRPSPIADTLPELPVKIVNAPGQPMSRARTRRGARNCEGGTSRDRLGCGRCDLQGLRSGGSPGRATLPQGRHSVRPFIRRKVRARGTWWCSLPASRKARPTKRANERSRAGYPVIPT